MRVLRRTISSSRKGAVMLLLACSSVGGLESTLSQPDDHEQPAAVAEENAIDLGVLPNGVVTLPDNDLAELSMFSFRNNALRESPLSHLPAEVTPSAVLDALKKSTRGDLLYDDVEGGTIIICSGRVVELGEGALADLRTQCSRKFRQVHSLPAQIGFRYMIRTVNGRSAVFRVLAANRQGLQIQWIYQPGASTVFVVPRRLEPDHVLHDVLFSCVSMETAVDGLRRSGLRVCFEKAADEEILPRTKRIAYPQAEVGTLLDELTTLFAAYRWRIMEDSSVVLVFPRQTTRLSAVPFSDSQQSLVLERASWRSVIRLLNLDRYGIQFPPKPRTPTSAGPVFLSGAVYEPPADQLVSVEIDPPKPLREILGLMCETYGHGLYYETSAPVADSRVRLYFRLPEAVGGSR